MKKEIIRGILIVSITIVTGIAIGLLILGML